MSTTLGRRVAKLEAAIDDPTGERQSRIAQGLCPDCGYAHTSVPTGGGAWRCVACATPFRLQPGPACNQACQREGRRGCNALQRPMRLGTATGHTPEQVAWFADRWARDAVEDLIESMAPEQGGHVRAWLGAHVAAVGPGDTATAALGAAGHSEPPPLVRAFLVLVRHHVETRLSVEHPDAVPGLPCSG